jgi:hypothetical protein
MKNKLLRIFPLLLLLFSFTVKDMCAQAPLAPEAPKTTKTTKPAAIPQMPASDRDYVPHNRELHEARNTLSQLLDLTPKLRGIVSADPSILSNLEYVSQQNPELAKYLNSHPEIVRNPEFYLSHLVSQFNQMINYGGYKTNQDMESILAFFVFLVVTITLIWMLRFFLQNRRWNRIFKVQTEMHAKLLDRIGSNQEMMAYLESDKGKKFFELAPISSALDSNQSFQMSPISRILAPLQIGIVASLAGLGLLIIKSSFTDQLPLLLIGVLALAIGIGFIISSGISWVLAIRLGIFDKKNEASRAKLD